MRTATIPATYQLKVLAQGGRKVDLDAPARTTIGQLRETVLGALGIPNDPNVLWFFSYRGEQLNDDGATLAQILGAHDPRKEVVLHLKKQPFAGVGAPATVALEPTRSYLERDAADLLARAEELGIVDIATDGIDIYVTLLSRDVGNGREEYTVRLRCDGYDIEPPSVTFVDRDTRELTPRAWPNVPSGPGAIFRPGGPNQVEWFVCAPGTREWYGHGHAEFRSAEYWRLANIIEAIHLGLNSPGYMGRYDQ